MVATNFDPLFGEPNIEGDIFEKYSQQIVLGLNSEDKDTKEKWEGKVQKYNSIIMDIDLLKHDEKSSN